MPTVSRDLPSKPHFDVPKREARELLNGWRAAQPEALDRIRRCHPKFQSADHAVIQAAEFRLSGPAQNDPFARARREGV